MSGETLFWGAAVYVIATVVALGVGLRVLLALPATYFAETATPSGATRLTWRAVAKRIVRNAVGALLVVIGLLLSLPGIPGQGVLTILVGVMLLDVPGRYGIQRRLFGHPPVLARVNRVRARFGRPAIVAPPSADQLIERS